MKRSRGEEDARDKYDAWFDDDTPIVFLKDLNETNTSASHWIPGEVPVTVPEEINYESTLKRPAVFAPPEPPDYDYDLNEMMRLYEESQRQGQEDEPAPEEAQLDLDEEQENNIRQRGYQADLDDFYAEDESEEDDGGIVAMQTDHSPYQNVDLLGPEFILPPTIGGGNKREKEPYLRPDAVEIDPLADDFVFQHTETTYAIDEDTKTPELRIWGVDQKGCSVLLRDRRSKPYFFAHISSLEEAQQIRHKLNRFLAIEFRGKRAGDIYGDFVLRVEPVMGRSICGYHRNRPLDRMHKFIMAHPSHVAAARNCLEFCNKSVTDRPYKTYEANVPFELRCMIDANINGCEWIRLKAGSYTHISEDGDDDYARISTAQYEFIATEGRAAVENIPASVKGDLAPMRYLSYDIEVLRKKKGFPTAKEDPAILICAALNVTGVGIVHQAVFALAPSEDAVRKKMDAGQVPGYDPIPGATVYVYKSEITMLLAFSRYIRACDPEALTGWNTTDFDLPYLAGRARVLGCFDSFMSFSRIRGKTVWIRQKTFQSKAYGAKVSNEMLCEGRFDYDGLTFMLRGQMEKYRSYKLNHISKEVLDDQKLDVDYTQIPTLYEGTNADRTRLAWYLFLTLLVCPSNVPVLGTASRMRYFLFRFSRS
jgi:hypothetical protein